MSESTLPCNNEQSLINYFGLRAMFLLGISHFKLSQINSGDNYFLVFI